MKIELDAKASEQLKADAAMTHHDPDQYIRRLLAIGSTLVDSEVQAATATILWDDDTTEAVDLRKELNVIDR